MRTLTSTDAAGIIRFADTLVPLALASVTRAPGRIIVDRGVSCDDKHRVGPVGPVGSASDRDPRQQ